MKTNKEINAKLIEDFKFYKQLADLYKKDNNEKSHKYYWNKMDTIAVIYAFANNIDYGKAYWNLLLLADK